MARVDPNDGADPAPQNRRCPYVVPSVPHSVLVHRASRASASATRWWPLHSTPESASAASPNRSSAADTTPSAAAARRFPAGKAKHHQADASASALVVELDGLLAFCRLGQARRTSAGLVRMISRRVSIYDYPAGPRPTWFS